MYPANHFALFPPFARDDRVFVAMSFAAQFEARWRNVLSPAIADESDRSPALAAHRIDLGRRGDSILSEILDEIGRCRLIVADITTIGRIDGQPVRNGNVLYEVGLAHSVRMAEEVILIRSDADPLPFDVANVRVHSYSPDEDPAEARATLKGLIDGALQSIVSEQARTVARVAELLDFECYDVLYEIGSDGPGRHPGREDTKTGMGLLQIIPRIAGIQRLLEVGAISTQYQRLTARHIGGYSELPKQDLVRYVLTPFGTALLEFILQRMDYYRHDVLDAFNAAKSRDAAL